MTLNAENVVQGLVGLGQGEAAILLEQHGFVLRTTKLDGEGLLIHDDLQTKRVNVAVDNDIVTEVFGLY